MTLSRFGRLTGRNVLIRLGKLCLILLLAHTAPFFFSGREMVFPPCAWKRPALQGRARHCEVMRATRRSGAGGAALVLPALPLRPGAGDQAA